MDGEPTDNAVMVKGITINIGFHPERLKAHREEISKFLDELPVEFKDGYSFLGACIDKDGKQWGEHHNVEQLMLLGIASGRVKLLLPRDLWKSLPGGMPYFIVLPAN